MQMRHGLMRDNHELVQRLQESDAARKHAEEARSSLDAENQRLRGERKAMEAVLEQYKQVGCVCIMWVVCRIEKWIFAQ